MRKRFIIVVDSSDKEIDDKLQEYIKEKSFGWWHWINNMWLITTSNPDVSSSSLRDDIKKFTKNKSIIIFEIQNSTSWAGVRSGSKKKNMFEWLHSTWTKD